MLCAYNQELISRMLDEELSSAERHALHEHLPHCAACSALYESFQALSRALDEQLEAPPASLRETVMAELRREELRKKNRLARPVKIVLGTAACLALVLGLSLGSGLLPQQVSTTGKNSALLAGAKNAMPAHEEASEEAASERALFDAAAGAEEAAPAPAAAAEANTYSTDADAESLQVYDLSESLSLEQLQELLGLPALVDLESLAKLQPLYRLLVAGDTDSVAVDCYLLDNMLLYSMDAQPLRLAACSPEALDALLRDAR